MMTVMVRLLGAPSIDADGRTPRSAEGPQVLGRCSPYLVLTERPPTRQRLARRCSSPDADDPLGALRWSLADLRRSLRPYAELSGDPVADPRRVACTDRRRAGLAGTPGGWHTSRAGRAARGPAPSTAARVRDLAAGRASTARAAVRGTAARGGLAAPRLRQATTKPSDVANRLVDDEPARRELPGPAGPLPDRGRATASAALDQVERLLAALRERAGHRPVTGRPAAAARAEPAAARSAAPPGRAAAIAQLEAGQAAVNAGAVDAGLDCLRRAVAEADACGDTGPAAAGAHRARQRPGPRRPWTRRGGRRDPPRGPGRGRAAGDQAAAARASRELGVRRRAGRPAAARGRVAGPGGDARRRRRRAVRGPGVRGHEPLRHGAATATRSRRSTLSVERALAQRIAATGRVVVVADRAPPPAAGRERGGRRRTRPTIELVARRAWMAFAPGRRASWPTSTAPRAAPSSRTTATSTPSPWPARSATPAGRASPPVAPACSRRRPATSPQPWAVWRTRPAGARGGRTPTSGSTPTSWTPAARSP